MLRITIYPGGGGICQRTNNIHKDQYIEEELIHMNFKKLEFMKMQFKKIELKTIPLV